MIKIPIVYASDENFLPQTYVSIYSVLANRKEEYFINFYILIPEESAPVRYDIKWEFKNYSIKYLYISKEHFQNVDMTIQHITKPTYYRLLIPELLKLYGKCIYLDGDTICCNDIFELYKTEIGDNYLAASMGALLYFDVSNIEKRLDIPSAKHYFNAGVLLMNLEQMREDDLVKHFLKESIKNYPTQDQDVLNKCCYGKITLLPLRCNVYANVFVEPTEIALQRFGLDEIEEAINNPMIIHYPREYSKPWKNSKCAKGIEWWNYATAALNKELLLEMKKAAEEYLNKYSYLILFDKINQSEQVVLWGFSEIGRILCDEIDKKIPSKIVAFGDNAKDKRGLKHRKYEVLSLEQLQEKYRGALIVVTSQNYSDAICEQLLVSGIQQDKIAIYRKKTLDYVYSFDKKYWKEMWQDILLNKMSVKECMKTGLKEIQDYVSTVER